MWKVGLRSQVLELVGEWLVERGGKLVQPAAEVCFVQLATFRQNAFHVFVVAGAPGHEFVNDDVFGGGELHLRLGHFDRAGALDGVLLVRGKGEHEIRARFGVRVGTTRV